MKTENNNITEEVKKDAEESGPDLKTLRESSGITLRDLFESTRIRISILEAIENEEFHLLPESVYTKTFIKTYARALGVESKKILSRYDKYLEQHKGSREKAVESESCLSKFSASPRNLLVSILAVLFIIVFVIFLLYPKQNTENVKSGVADKSEKQVVVKEPEPEPAAVERQAEELKTQTEKESGVSEGIVEGQNNLTREPYRVTIEATELSWLKITVDNNPPQEILLRPGEKISREATEVFAIDIGNAGGVNLTFQGEAFGNLGEHGEVVHLTLP